MKKNTFLKKVNLFDTINALVMVLLCAVCVYPLLYVAFASFSDPTRLAAQKGPMLAPMGFTLEGYRMIFKNPNILTGYYNTLIYVVCATSFALIMTILAAYIISRKKWMWAGNMAFLISIHMFFSGGLIPFYLLVYDLGWINTRLALIIPGALSVWNMIVLRTAMAAIPESMEESARIDGANDLVILVRILLPMLPAALAVQVLLYAVFNWNAWFNATIFLRDRRLIPIQVILREILINNDNQSLQGVNTSSALDLDKYRELTKYCIIMIATVPILFIYPFLQRYFVKGIMVGSIKG